MWFCGAGSEEVVEEEGGGEGSVLADDVLRDGSCIHVAELAVEGFGNVAFAGVQYEEGAPLGAGGFFEGEHQGAANALSSMAGVDHELLHFGAVRGVGFGDKLKLDAAYDLVAFKRDEEEAAALLDLGNDGCPVVAGFLFGEGWQEANGGSVVYGVLKQVDEGREGVPRLFRGVTVDGRHGYSWKTCIR